ncbi:hypothetical protein ACFVYA_44385 [Amycolatopsis sp. NPDC058278]|uniref:hypothetical protein n=1 Tax=Amycolatopsis sp. NPDC058278 TaxID=3346417 RepID=UPI0036D9C1C7
MSDQGIGYTSYIESELRAERDRRAAYDVRGQNLVTTSGALVTLFTGLVAIVKVGNVSRLPLGVIVTVCVALVLLTGAASCGIVAGWNRAYKVTAPVTLQRMLTAHWTDHEVDARNNVATAQVDTIKTLRKANNFKANWVSAGTVLQVSALLTLSASVALMAI